MQPVQVPPGFPDVCPIRHHPRKVKRDLAPRSPCSAKDVSRRRRLFHATTSTGRDSISSYGVSLQYACGGDFGRAFYMSDSIDDALALISSIYPSEAIYVLEFEWRPTQGMQIADAGKVYSETWNHVLSSVATTGHVPYEYSNVDMMAGGMGGHDAPQYAARTETAIHPDHLRYITTHGPFTPPKSKSTETSSGGDSGFPDDGSSEPLTFGKKEAKKSGGGSSGLSSGLKKKTRH